LGGWITGFVTLQWMDYKWLLKEVILVLSKGGIRIFVKRLEHGLGLEFFLKDRVRIRPPGGLVFQSLHNTEKKCRLKST
jgi:hypothetical protein